PDQRLMRIGEATPPEIRHRVGLAPDHVVQDPEAEILQDGADAENVVIGADHPERAVGLQRAAAFAKPDRGEVVISREATELVPIVVDAVDTAIVRAEQLGGELEIIGRVGEDEIDALRRQLCQLFNAVADKNSIERELGSPLTPHTHDTTQNLRETWNHPARLG